MCGKQGRVFVFVRWTGIKDHLIGFRGHPDYAEWLSMLEPFYSQAPEMRHYVDIRATGREQEDEGSEELHASSREESP